MKKFLLIVLLTITVSGCGFTSTDPGESVVFSRFGKVEPKCYPSDFYAYNPFTTNAHKVDTKVQLFEVKSESASYTLQNVHITVAVNFSINPSDCHLIIQEFGDDFKIRIIIPAVLEIAKAATAKMSVEKIIQERPLLKKDIEDTLRDRLSNNHIKVEAVSLTNISFDPAYTKAIEDKQIAQQRVQQAEFDRQREEKIGQATLARAEGEAKANIALAASIKSSPEIIQMKAIDKWDGHYPQYVGGGLPLISIQGPK